MTSKLVDVVLISVIVSLLYIAVALIIGFIQGEFPFWDF
jgi:hypothetical protein